MTSGGHITESARLTIDECTAGDHTFIFKLLNSPTWLQFIGDREIHTLDDAENYIQKTFIESYQSLGYGLYKVSILQNKTPIGICGFLKRSYLDDADIGFALLPEYEGVGYMLEAASAMMQYGKNQLGMKRIYAFTHLSNNKSKRLLIKLGFMGKGEIQPEGFQEKCNLFEWKDPEAS